MRQYASRFEELSRFAPSLILEEKMKAYKLLWGLKLPIRGRVALFHETTYAGVLECAYIVEHEYDEMLKAREQASSRNA